MSDSTVRERFARAMSGIVREPNVPARLVLALSGGLDSVALTRLVYLWHSETSCAIPLIAAHVHHGLRGTAADGDAAFCRGLALELGIDFRELSTDANAVAAEEHIGVEEAGRRIRYRFFSGLAGGDGLVLTGHHAGDQVETILLNLRRGAHARGLSGMRVSGVATVPPGVRVAVARPLLEIAKADLEALARGLGWRWREDATNADTGYMRNRIRHRIIPALEKLAPGFSERLLRRAAEMRAADAEQTALARHFLEEKAVHEHGGVFVPIDENALSSPERLAYAFRELIENGTGSRIADGGALSGLGRLAASGRLNETVEVSGGFFARRERDGLFFFQKAAGMPARETRLDFPTPPFSLEFFGMKIEAEWIPAGAPMPEADMRDSAVQWLRPDAVRGGLRIRPPEPGERFQALGAPGKRKIHDLLIDLKVPRRERPFPRVVADGEGALWVWPFRLAERARLPDGKGPALRICIRR